MELKLGPIEWLSGDAPFRPSLWLRLPQSTLVLFLGWQWPPHLIWLR
jgi:hypothetical protein